MSGENFSSGTSALTNALKQVFYIHKVVVSELKEAVDQLTKENEELKLKITQTEKLPLSGSQSCPTCQHLREKNKSLQENFNSKLREKSAVIKYLEQRVKKLAGGCETQIETEGLLTSDLDASPLAKNAAGKVLKENANPVPDSVSPDVCPHRHNASSRLKLPKEGSKRKRYIQQDDVPVSKRAKINSHQDSQHGGGDDNQKILSQIETKTKTQSVLDDIEGDTLLPAGLEEVEQGASNPSKNESSDSLLSPNDVDHERVLVAETEMTMICQNAAVIGSRIIKQDGVRKKAGFGVKGDDDEEEEEDDSGSQNYLVVPETLGMDVFSQCSDDDEEDDKVDEDDDDATCIQIDKVDGDKSLDRKLAELKQSVSENIVTSKAGKKVEIKISSDSDEDCDTIKEQTNLSNLSHDGLKSRESCKTSPLKLKKKKSLSPPLMKLQDGGGEGSKLSSHAEPGTDANDILLTRRKKNCTTPEKNQKEKDDTSKLYDRQSLLRDEKTCVAVKPQKTQGEIAKSKVRGLLESVGNRSIADQSLTSPISPGIFDDITTQGRLSNTDTPKSSRLDLQEVSIIGSSSASKEKRFISCSSMTSKEAMRQLDNISKVTRLSRSLTVEPNDTNDRRLLRQTTLSQSFSSKAPKSGRKKLGKNVGSGSKSGGSQVEDLVEKEEADVREAVRMSLLDAVCDNITSDSRRLVEHKGDNHVGNNVRQSQSQDGRTDKIETCNDKSPFKIPTSPFGKKRHYNNSPASNKVGNINKYPLNKKSDNDYFESDISCRVSNEDSQCHEEKRKGSVSGKNFNRQRLSQTTQREVSFLTSDNDDTDFVSSPVKNITVNGTILSPSTESKLRRSPRLTSSPGQQYRHKPSAHGDYLAKRVLFLSDERADNYKSNEKQSKQNTGSKSLSSGKLSRGSQRQNGTSSSQIEGGSNGADVAMTITTQGLNGSLDPDVRLSLYLGTEYESHRPDLDETLAPSTALANSTQTCHISASSTRHLDSQYCATNVSPPSPSKKSFDKSERRRSKEKVTGDEQLPSGDDDEDDDTIGPSPQLPSQKSQYLSQVMSGLPSTSRSFKFINTVSNSKHKNKDQSSLVGEGNTITDADSTFAHPSLPCLDLTNDDDLEDPDNNAAGVRAIFPPPKLPGNTSPPTEPPNPSLYDSFDIVPPKPDEFAHVAVVRKRSERDKLDGFSCKECALYYKGMNLSSPELAARMKICSRHKHKYQPPATPEHFWSLSFRDTAEISDNTKTVEKQPPPVRLMRRRRLEKRFKTRKEEEEGAETRN